MGRFEEARRNIRIWTLPTPTPSPPTQYLSPPPKSLFRSSSVSTGVETPSTTTPTRSYSQGALVAFDHNTRSLPVSAAPTPSRHPSVGQRSSKSSTPASILAPPAPPNPKQPRPRPVSGLKIIATSPSARSVHFPTLQSPTRTTSATTTEHVSIVTPASPSRHGVSGGRFSISGVLGMSRTESMSGAVTNLARLAEENPADSARRRDSLAPVPTRVRTESSPLLGNVLPPSGRRRSEEWSSRSWRMGEGPSVSEALGEFGAGVRRRESGELLSLSASTTQGHALPHGSQSLGAASGSVTSATVATASTGKAQGQGPGSAAGSTHGGRSRGGSLGRDSRLYASSATDSEMEAAPWGVDVGGIQLGECSALAGDGELSDEIGCERAYR